MWRTSRRLIGNHARLPITRSTRCRPSYLSIQKANISDMSVFSGTIGSVGADITTDLGDTLPTVAEADLPFGPINLAMKGIIELQAITDLPWWLTIAVFASGFRILCTPLVVKTKQNGARMGYAKNDIMQAQKAVVEVREDSSASAEDKMKVADKLRDVMEKHKCNPFTSLALVLLQFPLYSSCFFAVRRICTGYEDLRIGGPIEYFHDLSVADSSYLLGPVTAVVLVVSMRMGVNDAQMANPDASEQTKSMQEMMKYLGYGIGFSMIPASMFMPSGVMLYILSTSTTAFALNTILKQPLLTKALGIHPDYLPGKLADDKLRGKDIRKESLVSIKPKKKIN